MSKLRGFGFFCSGRSGVLLYFFDSFIPFIFVRIHVAGANDLTVRRFQIEIEFPVCRIFRVKMTIQQRIFFKFTWLTVYRRNYDVAWIPLTEQSHAVLAALCAGRTLGEALNGKQGPAARWFQQWTAAGLFAAVQLQLRKKSR